MGLYSGLPTRVTTWYGGINLNPRNLITAKYLHHNLCVSMSGFSTALSLNWELRFSLENDAPQAEYILSWFRRKKNPDKEHVARVDLYVFFFKLGEFITYKFSYFLQTVVKHIRNIFPLVFFFSEGYRRYLTLCLTLVVSPAVS